MLLPCKNRTSWDTVEHRTHSKIWTATERDNLLPSVRECKGAAGAPPLVGVGSTARAGGTRQHAWDMAGRTHPTTSTTPHVSRAWCQFCFRSLRLQPLHASFPGSARHLCCEGLPRLTHTLSFSRKGLNSSRQTAILECFSNAIIG